MTKGQTATQHKRLRALVHYVCERCPDPTMLGATKLNKVLWYVDTIAYRKDGQTISGETTYIKRQFGPVPKRILKTLEGLENDGSIVIRNVPSLGGSRREFISLKPSNHSIFTDEERLIIDQVIDVICRDHTAASISELSHDAIWEAAELGEEIPVYAVLASRAAPIEKRHRDWANKIMASRG